MAAAEAGVEAAVVVVVAAAAAAVDFGVIIQFYNSGCIRYTDAIFFPGPGARAQKKQAEAACFQIRILFLIYATVSFLAMNFFTHSVVIDFGLSSGKPSALSQQRLARTPSARETPKSTV